MQINSTNFSEIKIIDLLKFSDAHMEKFFTQNNLVSLLYQELPTQRELQLQKQIQLDDQLADEYAMLKEAKDMLPKALFNPAPSVLDRILKYSSENVSPTFC